MKCEQVEPLLVEWVLEPLRDPAEDWGAVETHLRACPRCAASLARLGREMSAIHAAMGRGMAPADIAEPGSAEPGGSTHRAHTNGNRHPGDGMRNVVGPCAAGEHGPATAQDHGTRRKSTPKHTTPEGGTRVESQHDPAMAQEHGTRRKSTLKHTTPEGGTRVESQHDPAMAQDQGTRRGRPASGPAKWGGRTDRHRLMHSSARRRIVPLLAGAAAMAACLGLAFWCLQTLLPGGRQGELASDGASRAAFALATPYDAEGRRGRPFVVGAGQSVTAGLDQGIELDIGGRHNLRLDPGTQLALNETPQRGCVIALSRGRVRVSIQRAAGEGPCELITPHARVVVLGTVFTVASGLDATRLSVSRGRVRLSTTAGVSQIVAAGQAYRTTGAAVLADGGDPAVADVAAELLSDPLRVLQRSAWYRQRFGCLLHLRDYLAEQDAAPDEISLLAISAEPWCLQRPRAPGLADYQQRKAGLQRAAAAHGCRVEWPHPATREQAEAIVAEALREGSLVLAYGLADEPLRVRCDADLAGQAREWSYRFLGEAAATPFALCVVSRSGGTRASSSAAASEAIADVRAMLAGVADSQYEVGISAIEPASSTCRASEAASRMATMKALTALGRLGPVCQEWLCRQAGSRAPNTGLYSQLDSEVASMFATGAFEETHCVQAQLAESAGRCAATLWGLAAALE